MWQTVIMVGSDWDALALHRIGHNFPIVSKGVQPTRHYIRWGEKGVIGLIEANKVVGVVCFHIACIEEGHQRCHVNDRSVFLVVPE